MKRSRSSLEQILNLLLVVFVNLLFTPSIAKAFGHFVSLVGHNLLFLHLLVEVSLHKLVSCLQFRFSALLSYLDNMLDLNVKHVSHRLIVCLHRRSLIVGTSVRFDRPLSRGVILGLSFFLLLGHAPPLHLLLPELVVFTLLKPLLLSLAFSLQCELLDLIVELSALLDRLIHLPCEIGVLCFGLGILLM